ncbi:MAG: hypothetical protein ACXV76_13715, partial [Halobacteriota archaeon]
LIYFSIKGESQTDEQKYCRYCGAANSTRAAFCAKCGGAFSTQSSQHLSPQDPPYLEDEIVNKIRGLLLPVTGKKILAGGVLLVFLIIIVSAMASPSSSGGATSTPANPSSTSTPANPSSLLVEHAASASGPDLSAQINDNTDSHDTGARYYRVTIDGHDAYAAHDPGAAITDSYVFPFSHYSDAKALQASYVAKFKANGFTVNRTEQPVSSWGGKSSSILTDLWRGSTEVVISAADSATVRTGTNILNSGSEVVIFISP